MRGPFARDPAEHGVDQAGIAGRMAVRLHQTDGEIDRGMVGHVEEENLRGADQERGLGARRFLRQAAFEEDGDEMAQRAEPAQHGRDQRPRQRAVAIGEGGERGIRVGAVELLVERSVPAQHAVDNVGGDAADGEARRRIGARTGTRF